MAAEESHFVYAARSSSWIGEGTFIIRFSPYERIRVNSKHSLESLEGVSVMLHREPENDVSTSSKEPIPTLLKRVEKSTVGFEVIDIISMLSIGGLVEVLCVDPVREIAMEEIEGLPPERSGPLTEVGDLEGTRRLRRSFDVPEIELQLRQFISLSSFISTNHDPASSAKARSVRHTLIPPRDFRCDGEILGYSCLAQSEARCRELLGPGGVSPLLELVVSFNSITLLLPGKIFPFYVLFKLEGEELVRLCRVGPGYYGVVPAEETHRFDSVLAAHEDKLSRNDGEVDEAEPADRLGEESERLRIELGAHPLPSIDDDIAEADYRRFALDH